MALSQIQHTLKKRVAKGLNFGIEGLEEVLAQDGPLYNDLVLLKSQYNDLMHVSSMNTLPYEQIERGLNRLRQTLLQLIDRLEPMNVEKEQLDTGLHLRDLPTRRTHFFKLLDIHFKNLETVTYTITYYGEETNEKTYRGREAIYQFCDWHRRRFKEKYPDDNPSAVSGFFREEFTRDTGPLQVYFQNVRHMLSYALEEEVEQGFFLDILRALFSSWEKVLLFHYSLSGLDPDLAGLLAQSGWIEESLQGFLIFPEHYNLRS